MKKGLLTNLSLCVLTLTGSPLSLHASEMEVSDSCPTPRSQIRKRNLAQDSMYNAKQLMKNNQYKEAIPLLKEALELNGPSAPLKEINNLAEVYARALQESQAMALNYTLSELIACRYITFNKQSLSIDFSGDETPLSVQKIAELYDHILVHIKKDHADYLMVLRGAAYAYYRAENYLRSSRVWQHLLKEIGYRKSGTYEGDVSDLRGAALAFYANKHYKNAAILFDSYFGRLKDFHSKIDLWDQETEFKEYNHKQALAHAAIKSPKASQLFLTYFNSIDLEEIVFNDLQELFCSWAKNKKSKFPHDLANHYWKNVNIDDLSPQTVRSLISYLMTYDHESFHLPLLHDCLFTMKKVPIKQLDIIHAFTTFHKGGDHDKALLFWKSFDPELCRQENNLTTDLLLGLNRMAAQSYYATFDYQKSATLYDKIMQTNKDRGMPCSKDLYREAIEAHKKSRHLKRVVSLHMSKSFRVRDKKSLTF